MLQVGFPTVATLQYGPPFYSALESNVSATLRSDATLYSLYGPVSVTDIKPSAAYLAYFRPPPAPPSFAPPPRTHPRVLT